MQRLAGFLARWIVHRPLAIAISGLLLTAVCAALVLRTHAFDSDVLNLLPADNPAVQGLKIYNGEFTQNRELAFLLTWKNPPTDRAQYHDAFVKMLRQQPWIERVFDAPPLETRVGRKTIHELLVPLLLNLPAPAFAETMTMIAPGAMRARLGRLVRQTAAGSPKAGFELESDPLGLAALASRPLWETIEFSDTFDLVAPDGTAIIVPVITNQPDNSAEACQTMMLQARRFLAEARERLGPDGPELGVTGRSAYVDEISGSMHRDLVLTSLASLLCVTALFWVGFRRFFPLLGISAILALTALVTMAGGTLIFDQLNIIAISFCSILFGLGDDFSLLLCQRYYQSRAAGLPREAAIATSIRHGLPGILWVALTTGLGFLALCFSGSRGFAQLGVLVAVGVMLCALFMPVYLFLFVGQAPPQSAETGPARTFAHWSVNSPFAILRLGAGLFGLAVLVAVLPWRSLAFDISPASLEPRQTPAAKTLALMMEKFPATFEPVMVVLPRPDAAQLAALDQTVRKLKDDGLITAFSSPSALVLDAARRASNEETVRQTDLAAARAALQEAGEAEGLHAAALAETIAVLDGLEQEAADPTGRAWRDFLAPDSPWWFLLDRMVSPVSPAVIASLQTEKTITIAQRVEIAQRLTAAVPDALVTGWSQALVGLIPWARYELFLFGALVALVVLSVLAIVYRNARLWLLHTLALLAALVGTVATLKLLNLPINLLNVLAFPLMLGVGVDYGTHVILAAREEGDVLDNLAGVIKPVALSGLTTAVGFGSLLLAKNPSLSGFGAICAIGVILCLAASLLIVAPGAAAILRPRGGSER